MSGEGGSAAPLSLVVTMYEADLTAGHSILETLRSIGLSGRELSGGGGSFALTCDRSCNGCENINWLSLDAFSILLFASQGGSTGRPSTAITSVGKIGEPFVEGELVESSIVAVVAMANVKFSLRPLYRSWLEN